MTLEQIIEDVEKQFNRFHYNWLIRTDPVHGYFANIYDNKHNPPKITSKAFGDTPKEALKKAFIQLYNTGGRRELHCPRCGMNHAKYQCPETE